MERRLSSTRLISVRTANIIRNQVHDQPSHQILRLGVAFRYQQCEGDQTLFVQGQAHAFLPQVEQEQEGAGALIAA